VWIPSDKWDRGNLPIDVAALPGNPCVGAIDLASSGDIAALVWEFRVGDKYVLLPRLFIPEDRLRERVRKDRVPYDQWVRDGHLITTPGDLIDYAVIRSHLLADAALFQPSEIAYDRWNANDTVTILTDAGLAMVPFGQGYASMSPAAKAFETEVVAGRVIHGGHPVLRWMMGNVVLARDPAGNIKPDKGKSREKIDGIVAAVMAHGRLMLKPAEMGGPGFWMPGDPIPATK
jgi:phage terminase large subunit-like protein